MIWEVGHTIDCNNFSEFQWPEDGRVRPKCTGRRKGNNNKLHCARKYIVWNKLYMNATGCLNMLNNPKTLGLIRPASIFRLPTITNSTWYVDCVQMHVLLLLDSHIGTAYKLSVYVHSHCVSVGWRVFVSWKKRFGQNWLCLVSPNHPTNATERQIR
jgi:hypothetical protein